jgi:two-component system, cell cycle sensor histidine kinase and response regulator CckA
VKQTGGYVVVQSEEGHGSTFHIYLPRAEGASEKRATPAPHVAAGGTETILLVEDEDSVRQLVRETLSARGYQVVEAGNGEDGLAAAARHNGPIDLIITDVVMPGMDGREMVKLLAQTRPETKVLFLSGYTEDSIASEGTPETGPAFLQKPFTLQNLSRKIREILGNSSAAGASSGS